VKRLEQGYNIITQDRNM